MLKSNKKQKKQKKQKKIKELKKFNYMKNGKIKNGPTAARRKRAIPKAVICFCSSIIPLMINKILKNPNIKGKI